MIRKAAGCVIVRDNSILFLHRIDKDWWEVPGGKAEEKETLEQAAIREVKEELVCDVRILRKLGSTFFKAVKFDLDYTWFLAEIKASQTPKIGIPGHYDKLKYVPITKLEKYTLSSSAKNLLKEIEKGSIVLLSREDILGLIKKDEWMMEVLRAAERLNLPDWWIGAGFVRSKVWDYLHGYKKRTPLPDIDLIYFDKNDFSNIQANSHSTKAEDKYQKELNKQKNLCVKWSVTNQARMHLFHRRAPYKNSEEALSEWAETATCVGVRLKNGRLKLVAPRGIGDLVKGILRPTFSSDRGLQTFRKRIEEKKWLQKWPKLRLYTLGVQS